MHILWLDLLLFLATFPGSVYLILSKIPFLAMHKVKTIYLCSILFIDISGILYLKKWNLLFLITTIIIVPLILFFIEKNVSVKFFKEFQEDFPLYTVLVLFPILEELDFRILLWIICNSLDITVLFYIVLSSLSFTITHVYYQGINGFKKIVFSIMQTWIYIVTENAFVVVLIHIIFNIIIFIEKSRESYSK